MLVAWCGLLAAFWLTARSADQGLVEFLLTSVERALDSPWAPWGLLGLYMLRPVLLVPITVVNLASGFFLGAVAGVALGMLGTLLSATVGYGIGRFMGSEDMAERLTTRWPFVELLKSRGFESVVTGGLMYLHADVVNLPSGLLRLHFPRFLLGIMLGNSLTLTTAVLTGASVDDDLAGARISVEPWYLIVAAMLLVISLGLAWWLRRRVRPLR